MGGLVGREVGLALSKMALAALVMTLPALGAHALLEGARVDERGLAGQLVNGLVPVAVGAVAYLLACHVLRLAEVASVAAAFRRRTTDSASRNGSYSDPTP
jgi:hypothetical protein